MHTDAVDVFTCTHCSAVPSTTRSGNAQLSIVRHTLGCPTLCAQVRTRWGTRGERVVALYHRRHAYSAASVGLHR